MLKSLLSSVLVLALAGEMPAADWAQWRGPFFNGSTDEKNLPAEWSQTDNVSWVADLAGVAASTPVVWDKYVFLSGVDAAKGTLMAMAFDRATGKLLWSHDVAKGTSQDQRSNYASSSPATDGKNVVYFFGNGDLVCYQPDGSRRWARNIQKDYGPFAFNWTFSSSPLLYGGKLYVQVLQRDVPVRGRGRADGDNPSYLLALDPDTGKTLWKVERPSAAVEESRESFATPVPFQHGGRDEILIAGGDAISGHDPATGKELWRWGTWNPKKIVHWRLVPSPVGGGGVVLACAPKGDPIYAVKAGQSGTLDDSALAWVSREARDVSADVPTPAFYDGDYFVLSDLRKTLSRVEPATGKVKWTVKTPGREKYEASPLAADGKIYIVNFEGQVSVLDAADGKLLRSIPMDQPTGGEVVRASVVAAGGQLFIRTTRKLYCIGKSR